MQLKEQFWSILQTFAPECSAPKCTYNCTKDAKKVSLSRNWNGNSFIIAPDLIKISISQTISRDSSELHATGSIFSARRPKTFQKHILSVVSME
jgi:hypothetical protein